MEIFQQCSAKELFLLIPLKRCNQLTVSAATAEAIQEISMQTAVNIQGTNPIPIKQLQRIPNRSINIEAVQIVLRLKAALVVVVVALRIISFHNVAIITLLRIQTRISSWKS